VSTALMWFSTMSASDNKVLRYNGGEKPPISWLTSRPHSAFLRIDTLPRSAKADLGRVKFHSSLAASKQADQVDHQVGY
jgi:hypothetical protein